MSTKTVCDYPVRNDICSAIVEKPVEVKVDGKTHVLDICTDHAQPMRDLIEKVGGKKAPRVPTQPNGHRRRKVSDSEIREWAVGKGIEVNMSGRVPNAIKEQFAKAH